VEIGGHINKPNEPDCTRDSKHFKLSVDRAEMVFNAMIKKGIFAERMLPKGYGNWRMLYPSASNAQEMRENRRVEIKFIDCKSEELLAKHSKD
jgi:flagellar motor protein MotB